MRFFKNRRHLLLLTFLAVYGLQGCGRDTPLKIGDRAPGFSLPSLTGEMVTLNRFRGKNIFLLFWNQGCVFCQTRDIIAVNAIYLKGRQTGLVVLAVNVGESKGDVANFVREKELTYPVLLDRDGSVSRKTYKVYLVPALFIINKEGIVEKRLSGYITVQSLLDFAAPYL